MRVLVLSEANMYIHIKNSIILFLAVRIRILFTIPN
jgi:hypothetical protein